MFITNSSVTALVIDKEDVEETGEYEKNTNETIGIEDKPKKKTKSKNPIGFNVLILVSEIGVIMNGVREFRGVLSLRNYR